MRDQRRLERESTTTRDAHLRLLAELCGKLWSEPLMRNADGRPVGTISAHDNGLAQSAGAVHWYLEYEGPQDVFLDDAGHVFALPHGTKAAIVWGTRHGAWLVGCYIRAGTRDTQSFTERRALIVGDLRERMREVLAARSAA